MDDLESQRYFNQIAAEWAQRPIEPENDRRLLECLRRMQLDSGQRILDVGCGTGRLFHLIESCTNGQSHLLGMDYAFEMTRQASLKSNNSMQIICGDAQWMPFQEKTFDSIIAFGLFPHIARKEQALVEFYRILKPGGRLGVFHLKGSKELNQLHRNLGGVVHDHRLPAPHQMHQLLKEAGFEIEMGEDQSDRYFFISVKRISKDFLH